MNKKLFASLVLLLGLFVYMSKTVKADNLSEAQTAGGMTYATFTTSGVVFAGGGNLYAVYDGTGDPTSYFAIYDTAVVSMPVGGNANFPLALGSSTTVMPPTIFNSTSSLTGVSGVTNNLVVNFMPYGVRIKNGLYLFISSVGRQVSIYSSK